MACKARLFGTDGEEIRTFDSWFAHAKPEGGEAQWKDGYSAKEQAKAWFRSETPSVPDELCEAVARFRLGVVDEVFGRPEHKTRLDRYGRGRQHDMFACARRGGATEFVVGIEAKACEGFDGIVADRASADPPSNKRARCNLLSGALFGRDVLDEMTGTVLDEDLGAHGYQLWTAAVGTILEGQRRGVQDVLLVVQQFVPGDVEKLSEQDRRDWQGALVVNAAQFDAFARELAVTGSTSHETAFVDPGTRLHTLKVESVLTD